MTSIEVKEELTEARRRAHKSSQKSLSFDRKTDVYANGMLQLSMVVQK